MSSQLHFIFFFFNDTATTEIYTLSLHDALPISGRDRDGREFRRLGRIRRVGAHPLRGDRKSTRLNSSHSQISYAVFCLKKKKKKTTVTHVPSGSAHERSRVSRLRSTRVTTTLAP